MADIAIVGMAGRFPRSKDVEEFWQNICGGVECITFADEAALLAEGIDAAAIQSPSFIRSGGKVDDVDCFDAAAFGISPREAIQMDPQHRLFLEVSCLALDDAGYDPARHDGSIGVFGGVNMNTYLAFKLKEDVPIAESTGRLADIVAYDKDYVTSRVSYKLGLRGPSITVQSACSTSLTAISLACDSLRGHQCDTALAGGSSVTLPQYGYYYREDGIASPDGHCRPFDERAQGTIFGSGIGVVVLKRLEDALADGDAIHAVIKGTAVNNDGKQKVGYAAPSVEGQAAVVAEAIALADVPVDSIGFVECHGTATPLGDAVEIAALRQVFESQTDRRGFCALGTVKANVGHLVAGAGVAALIKTALVVERGLIPPNCNFEKYHHALGLEQSPFTLSAELRPWPASRHPRRAGVSSFGIGGTNVHMVLEEPPARAPRRAVQLPAYLLPLSARTPSELERMSSDLAAALRGRSGELDVGDVAYTLQVGRRQQAHRRVVVCRDAEDAAGVLEGADPARLLAGVAADRPRPVAFVFSGGGGQYPGLGRELYRALEAFRAPFDRCAELFAARLGGDFRPLLFDEPADPARAAEELARMQRSLPALFSFQYALASLWIELGVRPTAMLGHSMGEYIAASLAGSMSLEDAVELVAARGRLFDTLPAGAMTSVALGEEELRPLLPARVAIAAVNGATALTVSGPVPAVEELERLLAARAVEHRRIHIPIAAHSAEVEPILDDFRRVARGLALAPPRIPYVSNVTGDWITAAEAQAPDYIARHLRQPVLFGAGVSKLLSDPETIVVDLSPGGILAGLVRQHPDCGRSRPVVSCARHPKDESSDLTIFHAGLGRVWMSGAEIEWSVLSRSGSPRRVSLPGYPFTRTRYWAGEGGAELRGDREAGLFAPTWERRPGALGSPARGSILVVGDDEAEAGAVVAELGRRGASARGASAAECAEELAGGAIDGVVWLAPEAGDAGGGLDELRQLLIAVPAEDGGRATWLAAVTRGGQSVVGADGGETGASAVPALLATAADERAGLPWRVLDLPAGERIGPASAVAAVDAVVGAPVGALWALRGGFTWSRGFARIRPTEASGSPLAGATVVVTGAPSAASAALAAGLLETAGRIVLSSPSLASCEELRERLGSGGADVVAREVAPDDAAAMTDLLRDGGATAAGVIHVLSSTVEPRGLDDLPSLAGQAERTRRELDALAEAAEAAGVGWVVVVGSLAALVGGPGLAPFGIDTAIGDALASRRWGGPGPLWLGVTLDAIEAGPAGGAATGARGAAIPAREAVSAIASAIAAPPAPTLVLCRGDLTRRMEERRRGPAPAADEARPVADLSREGLATVYAAPRTDLERVVVELWEDMLGFAPIGVHDSFFELGGDSLTATRLIARLADRVSVRIPLKRVLEKPTVAGIADVVDGLLMEKVASMSDDEAERLLAQL